MKKIFFISASIFLLSCSNESSTADKSSDSTSVDKKDEAKVSETKVDLPFKMAYEGTPALGKTENVVTVMNFNGDFVAGKLDNIGSYFADSVHLIFEDGSEMNTVRDSVVALIKDWRGSMKSANQSYIAAVAVDNKEKGHEWVFQWIDESHEFKNGKKEHHVYHEDYRLENGKIREFMQYAQAIPKKK